MSREEGCDGPAVDRRVRSGTGWPACSNLRAAPKSAPEERCELCAAPLAPDHAHLAEPAKRRLMCVCPGCALLLGDREDRKYPPRARDARKLDDFRLTDAEWDALGIPIGLAFFFHSTPDDRIAAFYPGPAGPTECGLDLAAWAAIVANNPALAELEPDVEALLINRVNGARDYYAVPIDRCYALVGLIRARWRGVSGGGTPGRRSTVLRRSARDSARREASIMVDLDFTVEGVEVERFAVAPTLLFKLRVADDNRRRRAERAAAMPASHRATRRRYAPGSASGSPICSARPIAGRTRCAACCGRMRAVQVPAFEGERRVDLPVPCSFDFNVAATKYFHGLEGGEVPLTLLFSGTVFYRDADGFLQMAQIPWSKEAEYRLPVAVWQQMMDVYYPGSVWLRIDRGVFDDITASSGARGSRIGSRRCGRCSTVSVRRASP